MNVFDSIENSIWGFDRNIRNSMNEPIPTKFKYSWVLPRQIGSTSWMIQTANILKEKHNKEVMYLVPRSSYRSEIRDMGLNEDIKIEYMQNHLYATRGKTLHYLFMDNTDQCKMTMEEGYNFYVSLMAHSNLTIIKIDSTEGQLN